MKLKLWVLGVKHSDEQFMDIRIATRSLNKAISYYETLKGFNELRSDCEGCEEGECYPSLCLMTVKEIFNTAKHYNICFSTEFYLDAYYFNGIFSFEPMFYTGENPLYNYLTTTEGKKKIEIKTETIVLKQKVYIL